MATENLIKQSEEVEVLSSIYGADWNADIGSSKSYNVKVSENNLDVILYVTLPADYPSSAPPKYEISSPSMDRKVKENLYKSLTDIYNENVGETVIYQWVEKIRETIIEQTSKKETIECDKEIEEISNDIKKLEVKCPEITHGEVIIDRKSSFQGHAASVKSMEEVNAVLAKLMENKKILNATHNMYAYRIERKTDKGTTILQDCVDDGEAHAGGRMLHLLQILDQKNSLVVVSRWYGGIQLGPDRFRHINNATRQVLLQAGLLKK